MVKSTSLSIEQKAKLMQQATYASVTTACLIIAGKMVAWLMTDSVSLLSSFIDSILDVLASLIGLTAVRYSLQPPDEDHRFGHGKAEDIAAFAQSAFILGSALFIFTEALSRFFKPHLIESTGVGVAVMLFSSVLTAGLVVFQRYVIRRTQSTVVSADYVHYVMDLTVNATVIVTLLVTAVWEVKWLDPVAAIVIAAYIVRGAWKVGKIAFNKLMDKEFEEPERDKIKDIILSHPGIKGMHDLRTRRSGIRSFIQFHLEFDGTLSLNECHAIADEIEQWLLEAFPYAEVTVHQDPADSEELGLDLGQVKAI